MHRTSYICWARKISWLAILLVTVVGSIELISRWNGCPQPYSAVYVYDPALGYRFQQNRRITIKEGDRKYTVDFDSDGLVDRAGISADVIILGDGITAGIELKKTDRLASRLYRLLDERQGVLNLSVTGYGTIQQALLLEDWLVNNKARPKEVVLVFNLSNDVIDNVQDWDGKGVPGISLSAATNRIHSPTLPSKFYQVVRGIYTESRFLGCASDLRGVAEPALKAPVQISSLFELEMSEDMQKAMQGVKIGLARIEELGRRYGFRAHGVVWVDWSIFPVEKKDKVLMAINRVKGLNDSINWSYWPQPPEKSIREWEADTFVMGARHANANAILEIAMKITEQLVRQ